MKVKCVKWNGRFFTEGKEYTALKCKRDKHYNWSIMGNSGGYTPFTQTEFELHFVLIDDRRYVTGVKNLTIANILVDHQYDSVNLSSFLREFSMQGPFSSILPLDKILAWLDGKNDCVRNWFVDYGYLREAELPTLKPGDVLICRDFSNLEWTVVFSGGFHWSLYCAEKHELWDSELYKCKTSKEVTQEEFNEAMDYPKTWSRK